MGEGGGGDDLEGRLATKTVADVVTDWVRVLNV